MLRVVVDDESARDGLATGLDEIVREGARRMLAAALEAEVQEYLAAFADEMGADGRRLMVRNGHARPRPVTTAAGAIEVAAPRVNDKRVDPSSGEDPVPVGDPAAVVPQESEGHAGAAAAVPAWAVHR